MKDAITITREQFDAAKKKTIKSNDVFNELKNSDKGGMGYLMHMMTSEIVCRELGDELFGKED